MELAQNLILRAGTTQNPNSGKKQDTQTNRDE